MRWEGDTWVTRVIKHTLQSSFHLPQPPARHLRQEVCFFNENLSKIQQALQISRKMHTYVYNICEGKKECQRKEIKEIVITWNWKMKTNKNDTCSMRVFCKPHPSQLPKQPRVPPLLGSDAGAKQWLSLTYPFLELLLMAALFAVRLAGKGLGEWGCSCC